MSSGLAFSWGLAVATIASRLNAARRLVILLPKRTLSGGREVRITVPGDLSSGSYYISLKHWEDDPFKSENTIPVNNPYDSFRFSSPPVEATAGDDVKLKMSHNIGYIFNIYIQKKNATSKIRLFKKESSKDRKLLVVNLPTDVDGIALCCLFNSAICKKGLPQRLVPIHCFFTASGKRICVFLRSKESKAYPTQPTSHPFIERLIGTIRSFSAKHFLLARVAWLKSAI